jgi:hypothetical protein
MLGEMQMEWVTVLRKKHFLSKRNMFSLEKSPNVFAILFLLKTVLKMNH